MPGDRDLAINRVGSGGRRAHPETALNPPRGSRVNRPRRSLHHWMIELTIWSSLARKRSLCPVCRRSFGPHESPRPRPQAARQFRRPARRINLQENLSTTAATRQIRLLRTARKLTADQGLRGVLHGRQTYPAFSRRRGLALTPPQPAGALHPGRPDINERVLRPIVSAHHADPRPHARSPS